MRARNSKRLIRMRQHYEAQTEFSPAAKPDGPSCCEETGAATGPMAEISGHVDEEADIRDPFQERVPWFRLIGRSFVYLSNLYFGTALVQRVAIVDEHSRVCGFIRIAVEPVLMTGNGESVKTEEEVGTNPVPVRLQFDNKTYVETCLSSYLDNYFRALSEMEVAEPTTEQDDENQPVMTDPIETDLTTPRPGLVRNADPDHLDQNRFFSQATLTENQTHYESVLREQLGNQLDQIPAEMEPGKEFTFRVTVLQFLGVQSGFTDVFCQYQRFRTLVPPTLPISSPVPPMKLSNMDALNSSTLVRREDVLVWFEILELDANGDYSPVPVDRLDEAPCQGVFLIHQGLQRRLAITLIHEPYPTGTEQLLCNTPSLLFLDVHEVVVGRVRETPEWLDSDGNTRILSLSLLPARYFPQAGDDRVFFRFEAAWDSSLHASPLLNRVTPSGQRVYMTMSCYLDVEGCTRPVCLTKDLAMMVFPRESKLSVPRSLRSLWSSFCRVNELNRVTGVYDLQLRLLVGHVPLEVNGAFHDLKDSSECASSIGMDEKEGIRVVP
ncbi:unnamed protein product [Echinostoma caproni]|uniref:DUF3668 domain-containing protein n=1 Tax=Echinostoma caproni TaxID=27848 RepID=A0A183A6Z3_9TREM|nr:unnamed protein product [Echinostoma caproni]